MKKLFSLIVVLFFTMGLFAQSTRPNSTRPNRATPSIKRPSRTNGVVIITSNPSKCNVTLQRFFYRTDSEHNTQKPDGTMVNVGKEVICKSPKVLDKMVSGYYHIKFEHDDYETFTDIIRVLPRDTVRYEGKLVKKRKK